MTLQRDQQLSIVSDEIEMKNIKECQSSTSETLKIYIDGASRNNPGPSGSGICFKRADDIVFEQGFFIGIRTNNQAEYFALLLSAYFVHEYAKLGEVIWIYSDSQLLIRQMSGIYKVRDPLLKKMQMLAYDLFKGYKVNFCHIYREQNTQADFLANRGIDKNVIVPKKFVTMMQQHGIL